MYFFLNIFTNIYLCEILTKIILFIGNYVKRVVKILKIFENDEEMFLMEL